MGGPSELMPATAAARPDGDVPSPENLLREYKELRDRFERTTNALASAAHDLKTPLSILNGYVDLLHSEKLGPLSERQRDVLQLLVERQSAKQIAKALTISARTVEFHKYQMMENLGVHNSAELIHFGIKHDIVGV